jgi:hypothetical protein
LSIIQNSVGFGKVSFKKMQLTKSGLSKGRFYLTGDLP